MTKASSATKPKDISLRITRLFDARRDFVYRMWTEKHLMDRWSCPEGFSITQSGAELVEGGSWQATMRAPDGTDMSLLIAYDHGSDADHPALFKAVIGFEPLGEKTRAALRLILADAAERPHYVSCGAVEGGYQNLARLDAFIAAERSSV